MSYIKKRKKEVDAILTLVIVTSVVTAGILFNPARTWAASPQEEIANKFQDLSRNHGFAGIPVTPINPTPDRIGFYQHYKDSNGNFWSIYWSPGTGAHELHGAIRGKFAVLGWEKGPMGYPKTDEMSTPDGKGRFNVFEHGNIYWTPWTGANAVYGAIGAKYAELNYERGVLGYPKTDELSIQGVPGGRYNQFERGFIVWSPQRGAIMSNTLQEGIQFLTSAAGKYIVRVDSIRVDEARSVYTDTDTIALAARIDNGAPVTQTKFLGDLGDGATPQVNVQTGPFSVVSGHTLAFSYFVDNKYGGGISDKLILAGKGAVGLLTSPGISAGVGAAQQVLGWLAPGLFPGGCDGIVAADEVVFSGDQLAKMTDNGPHKETRFYPGTDSPHGCGTNSRYYVTWTILRTQ